MVGFSYIDDCDLVNSSLSLADTFDNMKASLQEWESLIAVTGGCLVPNKSSWYLVDYVWNKGHWTCIDPEDARFQLEAKLHSGETAPLKSLKASE